MSPWAWQLIYFGGPFALGLVTAVLTRLRWPQNGPWLVLVGAVLAFGFVVLEYYRSSHSFAGSQGDSDGEIFLGRWWEPEFTVLMAMVGYVIWLIGVGTGMGVAAWFNLEGRSLSRRAIPS